VQVGDQNIANHVIEMGILFGDAFQACRNRADKTVCQKHPQERADKRGGGATYTCDGTAFAGLKALCSLQSHVVEYQGKHTWRDLTVDQLLQQTREDLQYLRIAMKLADSLA
jgi:hypothetical protein